MSCTRIFSFFFVLVVLLTPMATVNAATNTIAEGPVMKGIIGALVDCSSRIGKEQNVAMKMAVEDFNDQMNHSFVIQIEDTRGEPFRAALAAKEFVDKLKVQAIVGPERWEEASLVAEISSHASIPMISLADATPEWAIERWPFFIQASPNTHLQMGAIAAIVQSWQWHQVTIIYEDDGSSMAAAVPLLLRSLIEVGAEVSDIIPLPSSASSMIQVLNKIKQDQCRVFLVHLSFPLATRLFERANKMEMMEKEYVWITTNVFSNLIHSINISTFSSIQGIVGVKSYFPDNEQRFQDFEKRFRSKISLEYGQQNENPEPGISAVQAYDATWIICLAMQESSNIDNGQFLLDKILTSDCRGLSGKIQFSNNKLTPPDKFQIINVVGRSYKELGFWSDRLGFTKTIDESATYNSSMKSLGAILWPGDSTTTPRGWAIPTKAKPLKIGVPSMSSFKQYVNVVHNPISDTYSFEGLAIDLFEATIRSMPYYLPYNFFQFDGTYDDLVEQIHLKIFDAVVGDVAILAARYKHAEFTHPYSDSGLVMIVPVKIEISKREWLFMKPFTKAMWALAVAINLYNGLVVWLIERNHCPELRGSAINQLGTLIWLAFTTLFSLQGEKLHSNLSRMAMMVWLFVALVITQTYTANLTSILTVAKLEPSVANVQSLQNNNKMVGYCRGSFVKRYLINVLKFRSENVRNYSSPDEYAQALRSGEIAAAFLEAPFAKLFLAKYCKEFIAAGPIYKIGGFGFAFPKGSPILHDVTKALLNVSESGELRRLENALIASEKCVDVELDDEISSLSPSSFWVLFILTGGTSTIALFIYVICHEVKHDDSTRTSLIRRIIFAVKKQNKQLDKRNSDVENPENSAGV